MISEFDLEIEKMKSLFEISNEELLSIADRLRLDMAKKEYLMMLESKVHCNGIICPGEYLALDFGNSNVRVMLYEIGEDHKYNVISARKFELQTNTVDYISGEYELYDIFLEVAKLVKEMIEPDKHYYLGHTFSHAFTSTDKNHAITTKVSTNFKVKNVLGYDINDTLSKALHDMELNVTPVCVINDTTAVLMAGKLIDPDTDMSCIIGTGYNMGMIDQNGQAINTESGAFSDFELNHYDQMYVEFKQRLKNNCSLMNTFVGSGDKSSVIAQLVMKDFAKKGLMFPIENITPKTMSLAIMEQYETVLSDKEKKFLKEIAKAIYVRGAKLIAAQIIAIINTTDPEFDNNHSIVFDGSVAEKVPYIVYVLDILKELYGDKAKQIKCHFLKDSSSLGAAVTAAMR